MCPRSLLRDLGVAFYEAFCNPLAISVRLVTVRVYNDMSGNINNGGVGGLSHEGAGAFSTSSRPSCPNLSPGRALKGGEC